MLICFIGKQVDDILTNDLCRSENKNYGYTERRLRKILEARKKQAIYAVSTYYNQHDS